MTRSASILLVEDNRPDVFLVRTALEEAGLDFHLHVLSDGEQVLTYFGAMQQGTASCPDLLLLDLNLPRFSGREVLEELQKNCSFPSITIVVISSSDSPKDQESAIKLGAAGFFRKPADLDEFMKLGPMVTRILKDRDLGKEILANVGS